MCRTRSCANSFFSADAHFFHHWLRKDQLGCCGYCFDQLPQPFVLRCMDRADGIYGLVPEKQVQKRRCEIQLDRPNRQCRWADLPAAWHSVCGFTLTGFQFFSFPPGPYSFSVRSFFMEASNICLLFRKELCFFLLFSAKIWLRKETMLSIRKASCFQENEKGENEHEQL